MRYLPVVSLIVAAGLAPSDAAAQQPAPLAGATRPNLRVLQNLPETQLFPLMNLVATALGVRCDYCHVQESPNLTRTPSNVGGWVWARDDKPQKRKAREMMQMVVELNATRFGGAHRVTCYTCHQGSTKSARTPPLPPPAPGSSRTPAPTPLPSADRVWANYVSAVGQQGGVSPGTGTIYSGWDERPEGRYSKLEIVVTADRYRLTLSNAEGTTTQGLDSDGPWVATKAGVQRFSTPGDMSRMRRIAMRYRPLKDRPANLEVVGVDRVADRDTYVATARIDSITTWSAYFDVVTGLLRREMTTTETLLLPLQEQVDYDDYREVNGVQFPFQVRTTDGASYSLVTRTFLEIRHNIPIDEALLRPPAAPR
jgi:hypothetical protein